MVVKFNFPYCDILFVIILLGQWPSAASIKFHCYPMVVVFYCYPRSWVAMELPQQVCL